MAEQKHYPFREGLPTSPDVTAIQKQWPDLKAGDTVSYDDIEILLGTEWRTPRFKAVTNAWRKREREAGRVIECRNGQCFYVATAEQISSGTYGVLEHIGRSAKKHRAKLGTIQTDSETMRETQEHQMRLMWAIEGETKRGRKNILPAAQPKAPVQISPPTNAASNIRK